MVVTSSKGKDVGTKRMCASCGTKFYDFGRPEPACPRCGTLFDINAAPAPAPRIEPPVAPAPDEDEVRRSKLLAGLDDEELEIAGNAEEEDDVDFGDDDEETEPFEEDAGGDDDEKSGGDDDW